MQLRERVAHNKRIIQTTKGRRDDLSVKQFLDANKNLSEVLTQQEVFWK